MGAQSHSLGARLVGYTLAPFVLLWDAGRWLLFGMFSIAERLDPFDPLLALLQKLVPLLEALRPLYEWVAQRVTAATLWLARPLIWCIDKAEPHVRALVRAAIQLWRNVLDAIGPTIDSVARSAQRLASKVRPVWRRLTQPARVVWRRARNTLADARQRYGFGS